MDRLWAPWRLAYVAAPPKPTAGDSCFICRSLGESTDRENMIVSRHPRCVVMLNRYPYNNGHLLVAPLLHKGRFQELTNEEMLECQQVLAAMISRLDEHMHPDGYNIGLNIGKSAGAGLPGHLHWHIVPRWNGDTNFMPVFSDTRVISQSLEALYDLLTLGTPVS